MLLVSDKPVKIVALLRRFRIPPPPPRRHFGKSWGPQPRLCGPQPSRLRKRAA